MEQRDCPLIILRDSGEEQERRAGVGECTLSAAGHPQSTWSNRRQIILLDDDDDDHDDEVEENECADLAGSGDDVRVMETSSELVVDGRTSEEDTLSPLSSVPSTTRKRSRDLDFLVRLTSLESQSKRGRPFKEHREAQDRISSWKTERKRQRAPLEGRNLQGSGVKTALDAEQDELRVSGELIVRRTWNDSDDESDEDWRRSSGERRQQAGIVNQTVSPVYLLGHSHIASSPIPLQNTTIVPCSSSTLGESSGECSFVQKSHSFSLGKRKRMTSVGCGAGREDREGQADMSSLQHRSSLSSATSSSVPRRSLSAGQLRLPRKVDQCHSRHDAVQSTGWASGRSPLDAPSTRVSAPSPGEAERLCRKESALKTVAGEELGEASERMKCTRTYKKSAGGAALEEGKIYLVPSNSAQHTHHVVRKWRLSAVSLVQHPVELYAYVCDCLGYQRPTGAPIRRRTCIHIRSLIGEEEDSHRTDKSRWPEEDLQPVRQIFRNMSGKNGVMRCRWMPDGRREKNSGQVIGKPGAEERFLRRKGGEGALWIGEEKYDGYRCCWRGVPTPSRTTSLLDRLPSHAAQNDSFSSGPPSFKRSKTDGFDDDIDGVCVRDEGEGGGDWSNAKRKVRKVLCTRNGYHIPTPRDFTLFFPEIDMDGELWPGPGMFPFMADGVRDLASPIWKSMYFVVFDIPEPAMTLRERRIVLEKCVRKATQRARDAGHTIRLMLVPPLLKSIGRFSHVYTELERVEQRGGEGIVLKNVNSKYKASDRTSDQWLKIKSWKVDRGTVVGHRYRNHEGTVASSWPSTTLSSVSKQPVRRQLQTSPPYLPSAPSIMSSDRSSCAKTIAFSSALAKSEVAELSGLIVRLDETSEFGNNFEIRIGVGLTAHTRRDPPPIGSCVEYEYCGVLRCSGAQVSRLGNRLEWPRYPRFKRVLSKQDSEPFDEVIMLDTSDIAHERLGQLRDALDDEFDLCGGDSPWGC